MKKLILLITLPIVILALGCSEKKKNYFSDLEPFVGEFVWVAIDQSKVKLQDSDFFSPYHWKKNIYYRGDLVKVGEKGIILKRKQLNSEHEDGFREVTTWIPYKNIISIDKPES
jgi:hypothetical protein